LRIFEINFPFDFLFKLCYNKYVKIKYSSQLTQCYSAGALTAKLYNTYHRRRDLPPLLLCLKDFKILKTHFGRYYNLMKTNKYCNSYILKYEEFNKLGLDYNLIGSYADFMLGYADTIKRELI
ncbi:MAG: hypothetical protein LH629_14025, partial [Ignavibacteria bacterium]|nr:hypothetical protein [Ignavibacteria bacterium]